MGYKSDEGTERWLGSIFRLLLFRFHLAVDTLNSTIRTGLLQHVRDFHPLDSHPTGRTSLRAQYRARKAEPYGNHTVSQWLASLSKWKFLAEVSFTWEVPDQCPELRSLACLR